MVKQYLSFLNQQKGKNNYTNHFMVTKVCEYVAELGFKLVTPGCTVKCATYCAMEPGQELLVFCSKTGTFFVSGH